MITRNTGWPGSAKGGGPKWWLAGYMARIII